MTQQYSWADGPFALVSTENWPSTDANEHASIHLALEMSRAHNTLLRGLNAIFLQGAHVHQHPDIADFLFFCKAWTITVNHHHEAEEQVFFPDMCALTGKQDLMDANLLQHKAFHDGLDAFEAYVGSTKPGDYSWANLKGLIDAFAPALITHLDDEIPRILALRQYDDKKLREVWVRTEKFAAGKMNGKIAEIVIPCALGCIDRTFENGLHKDFPPLPFFVPPLVDWWYARSHRGAWRFLPCDFYRNPRPLAFLGESVN